MKTAEFHAILPDCLEGVIILIKKLISQTPQHFRLGVNYREAGGWQQCPDCRQGLGVGGGLYVKGVN